MTRGVLDRARRYFSGMFLHPDFDDLGTPATFGLNYEEVHFFSGANRLHGFFMKGGDAGTILHCHGNAGNVTSHFPQVAFLVRAGYNVLSFDYAGFGRSEGTPSLRGIEEDARAALAYLLTRPDVDHRRIAIFGQSLGGAAAASAAEHPSVRCLVLEATFTSYRDMARATFIGRALLPIVALVIPDGGPAAGLARFAPRPALILHGSADSVVPARFSKRLHKWSASHTRLVIARGVDHLTSAGAEVREFADATLGFLQENLPRMLRPS